MATESSEGGNSPSGAPQVGSDDWRQRLIARSDMVRRAAERAVGQGENIIAVARSLYYEGAGEPFSIQQLAAKAGISLQTFYRYFDSKDELLIAVLEEVLRERTQLGRAAVAGELDPLERLRIAIGFPFRLIDEPAQVGYARLVTSEHLRLVGEYGPAVHRAAGYYREFLQELVTEAQRAGAVPASVDPRRYAATITDVIISAVHNCVLGIDTEDSELVGEHVVQFCLDAVGQASRV